MDRPIQLEFFRSEEAIKIDMIHESLDRVRKGTYARINSVEKKYADIDARLAIIERGICLVQIAA